MFDKRKRSKWAGWRIEKGNNWIKIKGVGNKFIKLEIKVIDRLAYLYKDF